MEQSVNRYIINTLVCVCLSILPYSISFGNMQNVKDTAAYNRLFKSDEILDLELLTDMKKLKSDIKKEKYHIATLVQNINNKKQIIGIKVKTRGNFRKKRSICNFPPLQIKFDSTTINGTIFEGQSKLKMVTHCRNNKEEYEQYLFKEYLIYRTFNMLSDSSLRVRLARIKYIDTKGKKDTVISYTFFIERYKNLAKRLGGRTVKIKHIHPQKTAYRHMNKVALFQYMIGNTDWSVPYLHNIKILSMDRYDPPVVVPFDFDWSGTVNARYAKPQEMFKITSVTERVYRGFEVNKPTLTNNINTFNRCKKDIYNLHNNFQLLNNKERTELLEYYDDFYTIINSQGSLWRNIVKKSRKIKKRKIN